MDKLTKTSLNEVTRYIDDLLTSAPMVADALAQLSLDVSDFAQLDRETFLERLTNALCARKWYEQQKPDGLPELPLTQHACQALQESSDGRLILLGCFGYSLKFVRWRYQSHPSFYAYCRGVLASSLAPAALRNDSELRREFPPQRLCTADGLAYLPVAQALNS
jgi:hypothetical protein